MYYIGLVVAITLSLYYVLQYYTFYFIYYVCMCIRVFLLLLEMTEARITVQYFSWKEAWPIFFFCQLNILAVVLIYTPFVDAGIVNIVFHVAN